MADKTQDDAATTRRLQILEALGQSLSQKRKRAIDFRAQSGIEQIWLEDEEFYQGVDDANRSEMLGSVVEKPTTSGSRDQRTEEDQTKSTVFPNITQPYVDAAAARIADMLLPTDDRNWDIEPTPIPSLTEYENQLKNAPPASPSQPGTTPPPTAASPQQMPGGAPMSAAPAPERTFTMPDGSQMTESALAARIKDVTDEANRACDKARTQLDDWLIECQLTDTMREILDDAAKVGTGVVKGPTPAHSLRKKFTRNALVIEDRLVPESSRTSYWNLYPDPACGEDIHKGNWIWEKDSLSEKSVRGLRGLPGYIDSQLDRVLGEGPTKYVAGGKVTWIETKQEERGLYDIWYFHGTITREDIEACGYTKSLKEGASSFEARLTLINDHVVHAALNPLESGDFPYDVIRWKRRPGHWAGTGVARQMRTSQKMVVAATRNLMDNAGIAAGPMFVVGRGIRPQNNVWELKPRKFWVRDSDDSDNRPVRDDFESVVIPMLQAELTAIIQLGMKMAEDATGLPMLLQGQQGSAPDTVGGMTMLNNNATAVLRRIARIFDNATESHISRYYEWLMLWGDDDTAKGDMVVRARGSSALIERDAQTMELAQIVQMTLNPAFGKSPTRTMDEYLKSRRFDPTKFDYTDDEKAKMAQAQPPKAPQVEVAEIRANVEKERIQRDTDRDTAFVQAETERTQSEHQARMAELSVKRELAILEYATSQKVSLDKVKADLAKTAMQLKTQKELAGADRNLRAAQQVAKPAVEPPGRAPNGRAFQQ